jgi:hypothetical protein
MSRRLCAASELVQKKLVTAENAEIARVHRELRFYFRIALISAISLAASLCHMDRIFGLIVGDGGGALEFVPGERFSGDRALHGLEKHD